MNHMQLLHKPCTFFYPFSMNLQEPPYFLYEPYSVQHKLAGTMCFIAGTIFIVAGTIFIVVGTIFYLHICTEDKYKGYC